MYACVCVLLRSYNVNNSSSEHQRIKKILEKCADNEIGSVSNIVSL